jgi:hypothetical protein
VDVCILHLHPHGLNGLDGLAAGSRNFDEARLEEESFEHWQTQASHLGIMM